MKKLFLILLPFFFSAFAYSQQDPQFAHNFGDLLFVNPGYAGTNGEICASVINRQQWVGFEGAPQTTVAGIETDLKLFGRPSGVGLNILDDRLGLEKKFQAKLSYSYHAYFLGGTLGLGIEPGIINFNYDGSFNPVDQNDPVIPQKESVGGGSKQLRKLIFDIGAGAFYKNGDFYAGFSVSHIHQPKIRINSNSEASFLRRHYYLAAGYKFSFVSMPIEVEPMVFLKSDQVKFQQDYNIKLTYNKKFWLGVTYRNKDAVVPMIGVKLFNGLKIGYAYELSVSDLIRYNKGTHEIYVGYCFGIFRPDNKTKYKSVRFL